MLAQGATVAEDGTIVWPQVETQEASAETASKTEKADVKSESGGLPILPVVVTLVIIAAAALIAAKHLKQNETPAMPSDNEEIANEE